MAEERAEAPAGVATGSETALGRKTSADNGHNRMKQFQLDRINKIAPYEVKAKALVMTHAYSNAIIDKVEEALKNGIVGNEDDDW